ncbi:hypothetical protein RB195_024752 [Necator americanus]|uniref:Reverse transcriptase domain-containing protein n=1 Tax=Necator americanus TaxID=51031 RepID=A0ABR1EPG3_NECAM
MQLVFQNFEAAFDPPHRGRLHNALRTDGVPGKFVRLIVDMLTTVRTQAGCTTPFEVVKGARRGKQYETPACCKPCTLASKLAAAYGLRLRPNKCKQMLSEKIEKVGQSYVRGWHTSAKMPIIASGDDICSPIITCITYAPLHLRCSSICSSEHQ